MNLKQVSTVDIVQELLSRAQHLDALLALVNTGVARTEVEVKVGAPRKKRSTGHYISKEQFLQMISTVTFPKTAVQVSRSLRMSKNSVSHRLREMEKEGKARRISGTKPYLWELVETKRP